MTAEGLIHFQYTIIVVMKQKGGYQETDDCFFSSLNQFSGSDRSFLTTDKILQPFPGHFLFNLLLSVLEQELWCELLCN